jgi:hypothetical protein
VGQTSRVLTNIDGIEVIEVTREDPEGDPLETSYYVQGEKYTTLKHPNPPPLPTWAPR